MTQYDPKQIERGIEIEKEHKPTLNKLERDVKEHGEITMAPEEVYESISEDHLDEFKDYYTSLTEMENESEERSPEEIQKRIEEGPEDLEEAAWLNSRVLIARHYNKKIMSKLIEIANDAAVLETEEPESQEDQGPQEEDITIGKDDLSAFYAGKEIVRITPEQRENIKDALEKAIARWMVAHGYFPDVWWISDHGNPNRIDAYKYVKLYQRLNTIKNRKHKLATIGKQKGIQVYYEVVSPSSAQIGDIEESGPEEFIYLEDDEFETAVQKAIREIKSHGVEASSSDFYPEVWYTTIDAQQNYQTGNETTYSYHLKGFTPEEQKQVFYAVAGKPLQMSAALKMFSRKSFADANVKLEEREVEQIPDEQVSRGVFWWMGMTQNPEIMKKLKTIKNYVSRFPERYPKTLQMFEKHPLNWQVASSLKISSRDEEHTEYIGSPKVQIEPYSSMVDEAMKLVAEKQPELLKNITDVKINLDKNAYGEFSSENLHSVYINLPKIEQTVRQLLQGQPEDVIKKEIINQIALTFGHESQHQKSFTTTKDTSEAPAERKEEEFRKML